MWSKYISVSATYQFRLVYSVTAQRTTHESGKREGGIHGTAHLSVLIAGNSEQTISCHETEHVTHERWLKSCRVR